MDANLQLIFTVTLVLFIEVCTIDEGIELLFTSNPREYKNFAVKLTGKVPKWLNGTLIRNGIGKLEMGNKDFLHVFDGFAKLTSLSFNGTDTVLFNTKFIGSKFYKQSYEANDIAPFMMFYKPSPAFNAIEKTFQVFNGMDNTNVHVHSYHTSSKNAKLQYHAVSDFWESYQFDPKTLETISYVDPKLPTTFLFGDHVPLPSTSHPVKEYKSDSYISFVSYMNPCPLLSNYINVIRIKSASESENIASIKCDKLSYMHSMGLSQNYAIIFADPLYMDAWKILKNVVPMDGLIWEPAKNTTVHIVNIHTGHVTQIKIPSRIHMHHINSYEDNGLLIVDYIAYHDVHFLKNFLVKTMHNRTARQALVPGNHMVRYKINIEKKTAKIVTFTQERRKKQCVNKFDFPAVNSGHLQKSYCFVYGLSMRSDDVNFSKMALVKNDLCHNKDRIWSRDNQYPSEPIFVPSPYKVREDDGILLSLILNGVRKRSYIGIFDAKYMKLIGKGHLPDYIPFTFHGDFFHDV